MKLVLLLKCETPPTEAAVCLYYEPECVWFSPFSAAFSLIAIKEAALVLNLNQPYWQDFVFAPVGS